MLDDINPILLFVHLEHTVYLQKNAMEFQFPQVAWIVSCV